MTPQDAVRSLVRYQSVENPNMPAFKPSNIFPSDDFVPPPDGGLGIAQGMRTGEALGIKLERKPGTKWLQPIVDYSYYLRFSNNVEIARVAGYFGQRMLATENDKVRDYRKMMVQWDTYRKLGNGNFGDLLLAMNRDPAMLIYLDGQRNVKGHPNENYSREILELFSLGVGNYTEKDIQETARAFSGWGLDGNKFIERAALHDDGVKTFLGKTGNFDGQDIVGIILEQPACARFMSRKLYRYFVREEISPELEEKLAKVLRSNNYNVGTLLETVFLSRDFYSPSSVATQIKSPVQLVGRAREIAFPGHLVHLFVGMLADDVGDKVHALALGRRNLAREQDVSRKVLALDHRQVEMDSGFNRREYKSETYNIFRGVYNGGIRALKTIQFDPPVPVTTARRPC